MLVDTWFGRGQSYVLMTCICKDHNREALQSGNDTGPVNDSDGPSVCHRVAFSEVVDHQNDKIANGYKSYNACIF